MLEADPLMSALHERHLEMCREYEQRINKLLEVIIAAERYLTSTRSTKGTKVRDALRRAVDDEVGGEGITSNHASS